MLCVILSRAGLDPTYVIGGDLNESGSGARTGRGEWFVAETDESDGSFLLLAPGLDTLSMNPSDIPPVKRVLRNADVADAKRLLEAAMAFSSHDEIERYVLDEMKKRFPQLISDAGRAAGERGL